jgi:hypothetical protein
MNLTQNGTNVTGTYSDILGTGSVSGSVSSPNNVRLTVTVPDFEPFTFTGTTSGDVNSLSGVVTGSGFNDSFTMRRQ